MKKYKVGYTTGVYDMFHIGHLNVLRSAKSYCDSLIVGVTTDEVSLKSKGKRPIIPYEDRSEIVKAIRYVDRVVPQIGYDIESKIEAWEKFKFDVMFVGSDWQGTDKWNEIETIFRKYNVDIVYLSHTDGISSTQLREVISQK